MVWAAATRSPFICHSHGRSPLLQSLGQLRARLIESMWNPLQSVHRKAIFRPRHPPGKPSSMCAILCTLAHSTAIADIVPCGSLEPAPSPLNHLGSTTFRQMIHTITTIRTWPRRGSWRAHFSFLPSSFGPWCGGDEDGRVCPIEIS